VSVIAVSPDALAAIQAVERYLFEASLMPIAALADDAPRLTLPTPSGAPPVELGLIPTQSGITLCQLEPEIFTAIARVCGSTLAAAIGVELAASLCEDEVLVAVEESR
jgi:hypothetical protein